MKPLCMFFIKVFEAYLSKFSFLKTNVFMFKINHEMKNLDNFLIRL